MSLDNMRDELLQDQQKIFDQIRNEYRSEVKAKAARLIEVIDDYEESGIDFDDEAIDQAKLRLRESVFWAIYASSM